MIPHVRPIKHIHVSRFNGSRSLLSKRISHASDYRLLQDRLQMPSWYPFCIPQESPEMVSSAYLCGSVSTASPPLSSVVSPSSPSVGTFAPPLHRLHRTTLLSLGHARRIRPFLCPGAPHPPHSLPPRAASASFFASHPPPLRAPCKSRCTHVLLLPSMCSLIYCGTFIDVEEDRAPFSVGVRMRTDDW